MERVKQASRDGVDRSGPTRSPCAIPAFIGPLVRSHHARPCPTYFEVSFMGSQSQLKIRCNLDAIVFRNFYCSHITIKQRRKLGQATGGEVDDNPWVTVLRDRPLMEDPHYEDDAQYWHVITTKEFDMSAYDAESTSPLRVYLHQPSPMWKSIGLQHFKCVSWSGVASLEEDHDLSLHRGERTEGKLENLCRGISEQVEVFRNEERDVRTS